MTQDEIIEMAERAGMFFRSTEEQFANPNTDGVFLATLKTFAKLVAAKEREAICQIVYGWCVSDNNAEEIVKAIRVRGKE